MVNALCMSTLYEILWCSCYSRSKNYIFGNHYAQLFSIHTTKNCIHKLPMKVRTIRKKIIPNHSHTHPYISCSPQSILRNVCKKSIPSKLMNTQILIYLFSSYFIVAGMYIIHQQNCFSIDCWPEHTHTHTHAVSEMSRMLSNWDQRSSEIDCTSNIFFVFALKLKWPEKLYIQ